MKKLLIAIIGFLPVAGSAQTTIKTVWLPKLDVDSATMLRTFRCTEPVTGARKEKLAVLLNKWFITNYTVTNNAATADTSTTAIKGEGIFIGSCPIARSQHDVNATDRLVTNSTSVDYKLRFNIKITVAAEKYVIVINNLKLEFFNVIAPLEQFYTGNFPTILIPRENQGMDVGEMYARLFEDINLNMLGISKSASKYLAKARKKGDL